MMKINEITGAIFFANGGRPFSTHSQQIDYTTRCSESKNARLKAILIKLSAIFLL